MPLARSGLRVSLGVSVASVTVGATAAAYASPVQDVTPVGAIVHHSQRARAAAPGPHQRLALRVRPVMVGLDIPWDVSFLPSGAMLVTERDRERILLQRPHGRGTRVVARTPRYFWHGNETGLMGIQVDPGFASNRHFYTCNGFDNGTVQDIRVVLWRLNDAATKATRLRPLVTGLPVTSGRHGGCRLRFGLEGALYIGSGDAAYGRNPQNLHSLGGKILRVDPRTGDGWPTNPFPHANDPRKRLIYNYGHRNVQGLALRRDGRMWSVEHGPDRDDEVNRLARGGNYGWAPVCAGGPASCYNEDVPMTDFSLPGKQIGARWKSGSPTLATSGATWLTNPRWGRWTGRLAVATLKNSTLRVLRFDRQGRFVGMVTPPALDKTYGRLRTAQLGPHGALYVTTANGGRADKILRVVPVPARGNRGPTPGHVRP